MASRLPCSLLVLALCLLVAVEGTGPETVANNYAEPPKTALCTHPPPPPPPCDHSPPPTTTPSAPPPPAVATPPPPTPSSGPRSHRGYCVPQCQKRCKKYQRRIRVCVRVCAQCCEKNSRCVPSENETCPNWDTVMYHGIQIKCP